MKVSVHHDAVGQTVARLALTVHELEEQLGTLDAEVQRLRDSWDGEARRAYERAQQQWSSTVHQMKNLLAEATRRLDTVNAISMETTSIASAVWR
ncbi:WXG100 family type VII secretion target [Microbacterium sp. 3J1]|uniref:WXG100 family type VII secretion target n=1 Tax=Microbacterium sp. 3J1 TaxID=861269 RepID=UPI000ADA5AAE|nr:WXG100 family type VII secretion target [Microbacterium sp. 3J1]